MAPRRLNRFNPVYGAFAIGAQPETQNKKKKLRDGSCLVREYPGKIPLTHTAAVAQQPVNQVAVHERRAAPRKPLQRRITLTLKDNTVLHGQAVDLTTGGMRVSVDRTLSVPQECAIEFSIMIEGQPQPVSGRGRILSCVCTGMNFSIGLQFVQLSAAGKAVIARFLQ